MKLALHPEHEYSLPLDMMSDLERLLGVVEDPALLSQCESGVVASGFGGHLLICGGAHGCALGSINTSSIARSLF